MDFYKVATQTFNTLGKIPLVQIPVAAGHISYGTVKTAFSGVAAAFCKLKYGSSMDWDRTAVDGIKYVGRGLVELIPVISTISLTAYDIIGYCKEKAAIQKAKVEQGKVNLIMHDTESLFGPLFPLSNENKVFLRELCAQNKELAEDFHTLIRYLKEVREKHLANPDGHVQDMVNDGAEATKLFVAILNHLEPTAPEYRKLADMQFLIMENALIMNNQVHEDYLIYGWLDHKDFDPKSPCLAKLSRYNSFND